MSVENIAGAGRRNERVKSAGHEYTETVVHVETFDQVMGDPKKQKLFERLLNSRMADTALVDEIYRKYKEKEKFEGDEIPFLSKRLYEFAGRMAFAEEAQKLFNPGEIEHIASGHDLLHAILMQNAGAAELMREQLTVLAMEHPDALRQIMDRKQEIDTKKATQRYGAYDRITDKILARYRISAEEFGAIQNLSDEDARKERFHEMVGEKMTRFEKATAFMVGMYSKEATAHAYDTLDRFQKDILIKQIEEHQQAIAGVLAPLLDGDKDFMLGLRRLRARKKSEKAGPHEMTWGDVGRDALVATAKTAGEAAADQYGLWKGMLGGLAGGVAKVAIAGAPQGAPAGGEKKEKPEKKEEKKEIKPEEENLDDVEQYENPNELFERFSQLLGEDVDDARKLLKKNLVTNEQSEADDKKIFALIKKGKKDDARNLLKKRLKIPDAKEEGT